MLGHPRYIFQESWETEREKSIHEASLQRQKMALNYFVSSFPHKGKQPFYLLYQNIKIIYASSESCQTRITQDNSPRIIKIHFFIQNIYCAPAVCHALEDTAVYMLGKSPALAGVTV